MSGGEERIFLKTFIILPRITNSVELSTSFACEILSSYEGLLKTLVHTYLCVHVMCMYLYFDMNVESDNCSAFLHIQLHLFLF